MAASTDIRTLLASRGVRCTRQREEIYRALAGARSHPSADELFTIVRTHSPGLSLATVYNTLEVFTRVGLCRRFSPAKAAAGAPCRYDPDVSDHAHVVLSDGSVHDLPHDLAKQLVGFLPPAAIRQIEQRMGVNVERISIELAATRPR